MSGRISQGLSHTDAVHPAVIGKELADFMYRGNPERRRPTFRRLNSALRPPLASRLPSGSTSEWCVASVWGDRPDVAYAF
jgi:hypothetical protein